MAPPVPQNEPLDFIAGDDVLWTKSLADYPSSDGWVLHYKLVEPYGGVTPASQPVVTVVSGVYNVTLAATATQNIVSRATYRLIGYVDGVGASRRVIYDSYVTVLPNVATATPTQLQTHAEKVLAAIQATIEGRATADMNMYAIGDRHVTKMTPAELLHFQGVYKAKVWRERNRTKSHPSIATRMRAPAMMGDDPWDGQP